MQAMNKAVFVLALSVICTPVLAQQVWTWTGGSVSSSDWTNSLNWSCLGDECPTPPTFPDDADADVVIPSIENRPNPIVDDPTNNNSNSYKMLTLTLETGALLTIPTGTCDAPWQCMGLRVYGHDALSLAASSKISIEGGYLELRGGGKLNIDANASIEFADTANGRLIFSRWDAEYGAPLYEIVGGSSNEVIRGTVHGIIEGLGSGGVRNSTGGGGPSTLVLWDREITGFLTIYARLINNGRVVADGSNHVITLACQPKGGSGLWKLDHASAKFVVEAPMTGTAVSEIEIIDGILALADMWVTSGILDFQGGSITTEPGDALIVGEAVSCSN